MRLLFLLLIAIAGLSVGRAYSQSIDVWDGGVVKWVDENGEGKTVDNPILIDSAEKLAYMAVNIKGCDGKFFKLTVDLDLNKLAWKPIGNSATDQQFKGTFDGAGHTIYNLYVDLAEINNVGLFGKVEGGKGISGINIGSGSSIVGKGNVGAIAGYSSVPILGCSNKGSVTGKGFPVGGIVGAVVGGIIENCFNEGDVTGSKQVGGIVGNGNENVSKINMCYNSGKIIASGSATTNDVGGIAGTINGQISNSYNIGRVVATGGNVSGQVGGIVGSSANSTITNVYNAGTIDAVNKMSVGGIVGYLNNGTLSNSYNIGEVLKVSKSDNVGSIAGLIMTSSVQDNCYYDKQMSPYYDGIGSIDNDNIPKLSTVDMLGNKLSSTFSIDNWIFEDGMYPRLRGMEYTSSAIVGAMPILLSNGDNVNNVNTLFTVGSGYDMTWSSSEPSVVMFSNNNARLTNPATDKTVVLTATKDGVKREVALTVKAMGEGKVLIDTPISIQESIDYDVLVIGENGVLNIEPGVVVTANKVSNLKAEGLVLNNTAWSNATLIIKDMTSAMPQVKINQQFNTGYYDGNVKDSIFQIFSVPISVISEEKVRDILRDAYLDRYNQVTAQWERFQKIPFPIEKLRGYGLNFADPVRTVSFEGQIDNLDVICELEYNRSSSSVAEDYGGLNLIGNPYCGAIDITKLVWNEEDFDRTVYVWNPDDRRYMTYPTGIDSELYGDLLTPFVSSCQGFWVRVIPKGNEDYRKAVVKIPYDAVSKDIVSPIYKNKGQRRFVKLGIGDGVCKDDLIIIQADNCTNGFENGIDGLKWSSDKWLDLYAVEGDMAYAVDCKDNIEHTRVVAKPYRSAFYTLEVIAKERVSKVLIYDTMTGEEVDITDQEYKFWMDEKGDVRSFDVFVAYGDDKGIANYDRADFKVWSEGRDICIVNLSDADGAVTITDMCGRDVNNCRLTGSRMTFDMPMSGIYVVSIRVGNMLKNTKLIIK